MLIADDTATEATGSPDAATGSGMSQLGTEFIRVAAHELRTPLTSIITFANMLDAAEDILELDPADRHTALAAIRRNAERMQLTVADLMLLAELESAAAPLDAVRVDLRPLLHEVTGGLAVALDVPDAAHLFGDGPLLRQLLRTAVDVAGLVNDADRPIAVTASRAGGTWTVLVVATVAGPLSAERLLSMRIPHPDHPGEHRTAALALMLGREIAARHGGGMVTCVEQRGVTVRITLPHS
ncbi:histidine kinase dimerization/phospho-acceptor domain-containing protein [Dactylosporangium sp. NPDC049742]|uniref:sensor histidine kinase n=1 Tax=Dactylosporangium sp. NPDC049742 TaxID=3154737 RepID=UPI00343DAA79